MFSKSPSPVISMFDLPLPLRFLILAFLFPSSSSIFNVKADSAGLATLTNMTIDDNATQSILYSPGWNLSSSSTSLDYGGFHHFSDSSSAFAVFNFTGVSIYFLSPLWPYSVGALLVLDGNESTFVDLQDHSKPTSLTGGPETVSSMVVWQAENLNEGNHTLRVEFAQGKAEYVVLDGLIYSYNVQAPTSTSSVMPSSTFSPSITSSTPTIDQRATSSATATSTQSTAPVIVGAVVGAIIAILGIIFVMIFIRYRGRISARFPQFFGTVGITVEAEPSEDRDFERSIASMSATNEATVLSTTSRSAERLVPPNPSKTTIATASAPIKATSSANNLRSASRSTVAPSTPASTSSRPLLPPINTKQLPPLPDGESESTSALNYRSLISAVSKRITTLTGIPQSGSSSSASSSFFPRPIFDEDRGMLSISRQHSLRRTTDPSSSSDTSPDMLKTVVSRVGTYPGATDKKLEVQETRRFPEKPVREVVGNSSSKARVPAVPVADIAESVPIPQAMSSSSANNRPTLPPLSGPPSSFARKKAVNPLMIIPENSISRGSGEGDSSPRTPSKRLSGGRIRMEKERQRRRHPRTPVTPQGPRSRPLPSPPASTPLPSSSSNMWSIETVAPTSPRTPLTPNSQARRRRPLPQTLPEARRSSAILDPYVVVPSKNSRRELTPVTAQFSPISASIPASSAAPSNDDTHDPVPEMPIESEDQAVFTQLPEGDAESQSPSLENDNEPAPLESPAQPLQLPTLPPLPSMQPFSAFLSLDTTIAPSRPRGGQHEYSLSLPSSLPSHIPNTPPIDSPSSSRGPLPTPPLSAHSAPDSGTAGDSSPRSQRRLPPEPLRLNNSRLKNVPFSRLREIPETQYLTIPEDLNGEQSAPPPYSGRRSRLLQSSTSTAANLATSIKTPVQRLLAREGAMPGPAEPVSGNQRKDLSQTFNKQKPQSVPETPSDWRTSSYRQSSSFALRHESTTNEPEPDETAADLLFELLDGSDGASTARTVSPSSSSSVSIRPLSYPVRVSRALSEPPSPPPSSSRTRATVSLSSDPRQEQDESQIPPVPPIPTVSITTEISISRETASRLPPPSPRSPLLTIPPHPTTPPPPVPTTQARRKVWSAQSVSQNSQRLSSSSSTKDSSYL